MGGQGPEWVPARLLGCSNQHWLSPPRPPKSFLKGRTVVLESRGQSEFITQGPE